MMGKAASFILFGLSIILVIVGPSSSESNKTEEKEKILRDGKGKNV